MPSHKSLRGQGNHPITIGQNKQGRKILSELIALSTRFAGKLVNGRSKSCKSVTGIHNIMLQKMGHSYKVLFLVKTKKVAQQFAFKAMSSDMAELFVEELRSIASTLPGSKILV